MTTSKFNINLISTSGTFVRAYPEAKPLNTEQKAASTSESNLLDKSQYRQFLTKGEIDPDTYSYAITASQAIYMNLNKVK